MAVGALVALLHDILVTVGIYSLSGFQVTPDTVVAFLTILGYSLYDTMVVFDRVQDNTEGIGASGRMTYSSIVNLSMNQVLARSINTSVVAIMPILSVLVIGAQMLGATTLQYFGLALFIGLTTGAYSSIFIASPLVATLKEREGRYKTIRSRLEARGEADIMINPYIGLTGGSVAKESADDVMSFGSDRIRPSRKAKQARTSINETGLDQLIYPAGRSTNKKQVQTDQNNADKSGLSVKSIVDSAGSDPDLSNDRIQSSEGSGDFEELATGSTATGVGKPKANMRQNTSKSTKPKSSTSKPKSAKKRR
jgi:preprotein translocase subunit SecF